MSSHEAYVKKGVNIEIVSIIWMVIEAAVAMGSGIIAHSLSLVAFGADSIIELIAGGVLLWRLTCVFRSKKATQSGKWRPVVLESRGHLIR